MAVFDGGYFPAPLSNMLPAIQLVAGFIYR